MHALAMILALSTIGANDFTVTTLGSGAAANAATTTSSDVTLAVSSTGNDNGGQPTVITGGDYSSMPFATIQAALDALPDLVCHDVEIDVGTGTFAGALVSKQGCAASPDSYPWIRIYGTRAAATLASGSVSGTATSGGTSTLTLTGASWTVDDLQGRILYVTAGTGAGEYVIATNTTDTITIPAVATFDATSVFQLEDLATVVSAPRGGGYTGGYVFEVYRNRTSTVVRDVKITYSDSLANGVFVSHATALAQRVVMAASSSYDGFKVHDGGVLSVFDCGYLGTTDHAAFSAYGQTAAMYYSGIMAGVTGIGIRAVYGGEISDSGGGGIWIEATTDGIHLNDCNKTARASLVSVHVADTQNGIYMDNCTATLDTVDIDDTTSKTIYAHESELIIDTALTGTGNVWGIDLSQPGNMLYVSTTPTITGSSGEVTFDGTNAVTWTQAVSGSPGVIISDNVQYTGHAYYGPAAVPADFPRAAIVVSSYDTPANGGTAYIGIVSEESADASSKGIGIWGIGYQPAGSTQFAYGVRGGAYADSSATGNVFAGSFTANSSRAAGANVALFANATGAAENYAFRILSGDFDNLASMNWDLHDNDSTPALSFNTDGLSCLLCFDTTNSAEKISTGATLELGAALDANGHLISDSTGAVKHGTDGTPGSTGVGDDYFGGDVEVDGSINADGGITVGSSYGVGVGSASFMGNGYLYSQRLTVSASPYTYAQLRVAVDDGAHLVIGKDDGYANRRLVIVDEANATANHGNNTLAADPTINQCSSADPTSDNTQCNEVTWNRLALGGRDGGYGCINQTFAYDDLVDGGGASGTLALDEDIPDGAVVQQAVLHSLTGFTGDTSAVITIGDGTDVDRYNTGTPSVFVTNASGVSLGVPSGTAWHDDAATVTVTITSNGDYTSVSAGQATILVCYFTP